MLKTLLISTILLGTLSGQAFSQDNTKLNILAFSKTAGYRHSAIPQSYVALGSLAEKNQWQISATENSEVFKAETLDTMHLVLFIHTSKDILNDDQQKALKDFVEKGGGLMTLHSGTNTEDDWEWYQKAIGATFTGHPKVQEAELIIEDNSHPATKHFENSNWVITDEWYSFDQNPRPNVNVLISVNEDSYNVDEYQMGDHPLVWYKTMGKGRVFQTALGHEESLYSNPMFLNHLEGAIIWTGNKDLD